MKEYLKYVVVKKTRGKAIRLRLREGKILITSPIALSQHRLLAILRDKEAWIKENLPKSLPPKNLVEAGMTLLWQGGWCKLRLWEQESFLVENDILYIPKKFENSKVADLYGQACRVLLVDRLQELAQLMKCHPNKITFKDVKTLWGSCSSKGNISLNSRILGLPRSLQDYLIIHEFTHLAHPNHSRDFWAAVEKYDPLAKVHRKALQQISLQEIF